MACTIIIDSLFFEDELWNKKRIFSKAEAFLDLIYQALNSSTKGQFSFTYRELADRWQWSISTTNDFIKYLKTQGLIELADITNNRTLNRTQCRTQCRTLGTLLTLCNCDSYGSIHREKPNAMPNAMPNADNPITEESITYSNSEVIKAENLALFDTEPEDKKEENKQRKEPKENKKRQEKTTDIDFKEKEIQKKSSADIDRYVRIAEQEQGHDIAAIIKEWLLYKKQEHNDKYKTEASFRKFLTQNTRQYPSIEALKEAVDYSMACRYKGIFAPKRQGYYQQPQQTQQPKSGVVEENGIRRFYETPDLVYDENVL